MAYSNFVGSSYINSLSIELGLSFFALLGAKIQQTPVEVNGSIRLRGPRVYLSGRALGLLGVGACLVVVVVRVWEYIKDLGLTRACCSC